MLRVLPCCTCSLKRGRGDRGLRLREGSGKEKGSRWMLVCRGTYHRASSSSAFCHCVLFVQFSRPIKGKGEAEAEAEAHLLLLLSPFPSIFGESCVRVTFLNRSSQEGPLPNISDSPKLNCSRGKLGKLSGGRRVRTVLSPHRKKV